MNLFEEIKVILRKKSGKKLTAFSVVIFLLITVIVFFAAFELCKAIYLKQMDQYLDEIPKILNGYTDEFELLSDFYEEDILTRAELGSKLYAEENGLSDAEKLERVKNLVFAASVSLLDERGQLLSTTGFVSPESTFTTSIQTLEPRSPHLELYPAFSDDEEKTGANDGKGFVLFPVTGNTKRSLVFEFSADPMLALYNALNDWSDELENLLTGKDVDAYIKTGDRLTGYTGNDLSSNETSRLHEELMKIFQEGNGKSGRLITLLGNRYLEALMQNTEDDTDILLTIPLKKVLRNAIFSAGAVSAIIGWGILLLQIYIFRCLLSKKDNGEAEAVSHKSVLSATWRGILVVLVVSGIFSIMLLMLDSRTSVTTAAAVRREILQQEIDLNKDQEKTIRSAFLDYYRTRAQMLADFLRESPVYQTHAGLEELSQIIGTDYLMRFDSAGEELYSSNTYTGFSVGTNLSEEYRAVLLGYPNAIVGPEADPYSGRMQIGTAILMTDSEGQPDGFLLAVYSAADMTATLKSMSFENTVNSFAVQADHIAAAISDADGTFIAHSDRKMIGEKAADSLPAVQPGSSFEGFTDYNGESVYVSATAANGKTLLLMVSNRFASFMQKKPVLMFLAAALILSLVYYPNAGVLIGQAMNEAEGRIQASDRKIRPITVFSDGYSTFLTLFSFFVLIASANGWWTSFDDVFSGRWSKGVHLYSLWAALFIMSVTLFYQFLIGTTLHILESSLSIRAKTIIRLAESLVNYLAIFFLFFSLLYIFGVNTTALLASAGVVSIAVGMGAKSMAEDLLAGFFMMLEDSIHLGDKVKLSSITGTVTNMGIRITEITDEQGNVLSVNNSKVNSVLNMSRKLDQPDSEENTENGA